MNKVNYTMTNGKVETRLITGHSKRHAKIQQSHQGKETQRYPKVVKV